MSTEQSSSEVTSLQRRRIPRPAWQYMHTMRLSSLNNKEKKTIRQSSKILERRTVSDIVVSDTQAKVYIK